MLNQQGITQQNIAIFYLMERYCIVKKSAELRALFNDTVSFHKIKYCYILLGNSLLI